MGVIECGRWIHRLVLNTDHIVWTQRSRLVHESEWIANKSWPKTHWVETSSIQFQPTKKNKKEEKY